MSIYPFGIKPDATRSAFELAGRRLATNVLETEGDTTMEELTTAGEVRHIEGQRFGYGHEVLLSDVIHLGERIELAAKQAIHRRAGQTQHDIPANSIRVRWKLEVEAVGFPRPPELQALFADVERERNHRARIRVATGIDPLEAYDVDPDPELVRIAEEAEEVWQNGLTRAIERNEHAVRFDVPSSLVAQP